MKVLLITHADAQRGSMRTLTTKGRDQALAAGQRLRELLQSLSPDVGIGSIISAPALRCVETAVLIASVFEDCVLPGAESLRVHLYTQVVLAEKDRPDDSGQKRPDPLMIGTLERVLAAGPVPSLGALLVSVHGDAGNALSSIAPLSAGVVDAQGFFVKRPVLSVLDYRDQRLSLLHCEGYIDGSWQDYR